MAIEPHHPTASSRPQQELPVSGPGFWYMVDQGDGPSPAAPSPTRDSPGVPGQGLPGRAEASRDVEHDMQPMARGQGLSSSR